MPISVLTLEGKSVTGLQATNLKASIRGTPVQIVSVEPYVKSPRIVLVIDASSSMTSNPEIWHVYLGMAEHLLTNLPESTPLALEVFATHIERTLSLTLDRAKLRTELKSLENISKIMPSKEQLTSLWEAVQAAPKLLGTPELGDVVLVLTDAGNSYGKATFRSAAESLRSSGIRLFWFFVEGPPRNTPEELSGLRDFEDLVNDTGGVVVSVLRSTIDRNSPFIDTSGRDTATGFRLERLYQIMLNIYRLEIGFPSPLQKGARWDLKVKVPNTAGLEVYYPPRLSDCGTQ
ncbi:MAG: vWA domain-containing protein [Candidatus Acidiferrales bacterium]